MTEGALDTEGEIKKIDIGGDRCDRTLVDQVDLASGAWDYIHCHTSTTTQAGKVPVVFETVNGFADKGSAMTQLTLTEETAFEHVIHPSITYVHPRAGSELGNDMTITGNNFSPDESKIDSLQIDGVDCSITAISNNQIKCHLAENTGVSSKIHEDGSQVKYYLGGAGWQFDKYDISALSSSTLDNFVDDLNSGSPVSTVVKSEVILETNKPAISFDDEP